MIASGFMNTGTQVHMFKNRKKYRLHAEEKIRCRDHTTSESLKRKIRQILSAHARSGLELADIVSQGPFIFLRFRVSTDE